MSLTTLALLCLFAGAIFRRQLFLMAKWAMWIALLFVALWFVNSLEIGAHELWPLILGAFGALLGGVLSFKLINNTLVNRDREGDIAGVHKKHDARLL